ncbi:MAG: KH domain-containing protein [Candidatus Nealsonbacteria bacterium]|nr:KH domain-containing protein [Candidatus Nealsonbacteria bacterium]
MLSREQQDTIKNTVQEFFQKATLEVEIKESDLEGETFKIDLETEIPQLLIGEQGQTLTEIQYLLRLILRRKIVEPFFLDLDVNGYKRKKNIYLEELAHTTANEVSLLRIEKELSPMSAQERRIVHLTLVDRSDVVTESRGEGAERRVVIKPKPLG